MSNEKKQKRKHKKNQNKTHDLARRAKRRELIKLSSQTLLKKCKEYKVKYDKNRRNETVDKLLDKILAKKNKKKKSNKKSKKNKKFSANELKEFKQEQQQQSLLLLRQSITTEIINADLTHLSENADNELLFANVTKSHNQTSTTESMKYQENKENHVKNETATIQLTNKVDLTIFNQDADECNKNGDDPLKSCSALKRLISALKYYTDLDILNNTNHRDIFSKFVSNIYHQCLDDYCHLVNEHGDKLEEVNKWLLSSKYSGVDCDLSLCSFTTRHYGRNDIVSDKIIFDRVVHFYKMIMDGLHFYIFHLFDTGLRTYKYDDIKIDDECNIKQDNMYLDQDFSRINKMVKDRKHVSLSFDRFKNSNKFSIYSNTQKDDSTTSLDEMYSYLFTNNMSEQTIFLLRQYIDDQHYDTDSIEMDVMHDLIGNISTNIDQNLPQIIVDFIKATKLRSSSFHIGYTFYYWPTYENIDTLDHNNEWNVNDHGGFLIRHLFVKQKYLTFKEEIFNYKYFDTKCYNTVITKVNAYMDTKTVKQWKQNISDSTHAVKLEYCVDSAAGLSFNNLLSVILYTDFSALSADFSSSFRAVKSFEPLSSIKQRNANYWWMAKTIRETVQLYGNYGRGKNKLIGPFYCGLSFILTFPEFDIRLCSPTSTTKHMEVAARFAKRNGIIVQLNNTVGSGHAFLKGFRCSWLSCYKEESEILFFGGHYRIRIESVRIIQGKICKNFESVCKALSKFNRILNCGYVTQREINSSEKDIIKSLLNRALGIRECTHTEIDEYVDKTFKCFCLNKKQIVLQLCDLVDSDIELRDMIMYEMDWTKPSSYDKINIFRNVLFEIFPNIQTIHIYTTWYDGRFEVCLSFLGLLSEIEQARFNQITIKAVRTRGKAKSWISKIWNSTSKELIKQYHAKNCQIKLKNTKNHFQFVEDCIVIERI